MKLREYFLCRKKAKITLFNNSSPPDHVFLYYREYHEACAFIPLHTGTLDNGRRRDFFEEELLNKVIIFVFFVHKVFS